MSDRLRRLIIEAEDVFKAPSPTDLLHRESDAAIGSWRTIGRKLKQLLRRDKAYAILDASPAEGGTWQEGGCLLLAKVLHRLYKEQVYIIVDGKGNAQHAVLSVPGGYLDSEGYSTADELITRWRDDEGIAGAQILPAALARNKDGINFTNTESEESLYTWLKGKL